MTEERKTMTVERMVSATAGTVVVGSLALAYYFNPLWLLLTLFAGLNLFQSAFTGFCPSAMLYEKMGYKHAGAA